MVIGIPKEILEEEQRVAALPETVAKYVAMGFKVLVESSAGKGVFRPDEEYVKAGAEIVADARTLYAGADVVLKVKQPCFNGRLGSTRPRCCGREACWSPSCIPPPRPTTP